MTLEIREINKNILLQDWGLPHIQIFDENSGYESNYFITLEETYKELLEAAKLGTIKAKDVENLGPELRNVCMPPKQDHLLHFLTELTKQNCEMLEFSFKICDCNKSPRHGAVFNSHSKKYSVEFSTLHQGLQALHDLHRSGYINPLQAAVLFKQMIEESMPLNMIELRRGLKRTMNAVKDSI